MRIKRFYGRDSAAALQAVRQEFGEEAVILETRQRLDDDGRGAIEVVAATDFDPGIRLVCRRETERKGGGFETGEMEASPAAKTAGENERPAAPPPDPFRSREYRRLSAEVNQLKGMVSRLLEGSGLAGELPHPLFAVFRERLLARGVSRELAGELLDELEEKVAGRLRGKPQRWVDALLEAELARILLNRVRCLPERNYSRVLTLLGPTGVGKTTTVAKLAAFFRSRGERVALLSVDTFRLGAAAQIREFGLRLEVPVATVEDRRQLFSALKGVAGCDRVLIDTIGRSGHDQSGLAALFRLLKGLEGDRLLVLPAALGEDDLLDNLVSFRPFRLRALLFTKLDETRNHGSIFNAVGFSGLPLSFFATGQRVPEDLELASGERLADLLLEIVSRREEWEAD